MSSNLHIPKTCQYCGKAFIAQKTITKYCCLKCAQKDYKRRKREEKIQSSLVDSQQFIQKGQSQNEHSIASKEFLSIKEASELLGASRWTIQRLIKKQIINAAKFGRRTIIMRYEIDKLFTS